MTHAARMGWAPVAQMIADEMPEAPNVRPPALLRRLATEFKGPCIDARDLVCDAGRGSLCGIAASVPAPNHATEPEWIEWAGGECPIPRAEQHAVRFRDGDLYEEEGGPTGWRWTHDGGLGDIVAYRVLP